MGKLKTQLGSLLVHRQQQQQMLQHPRNQHHVRNSPKKQKSNKSDNDRSIQQRNQKHYQPDQRILLVGEGNFSFTRALLRHFKTSLNSNDSNQANDEIEELKRFLDSQENSQQTRSIVATTLDSREITLEKYPDAAQILSDIEAEGSGVKILFDCDATNLQKTLLKRLKNASNNRLSVKINWPGSAPFSIDDHALPPECQFDIILFHFPHCGCGITDQNRNIRANQELLLGFFNSARQFLSPNGEIHVTLKDRPPYTDWNIKKLANASGLQCKTSFKFEPGQWSGYAHRRTLGFKEGLSSADNEELGDCRTFVFNSPGATTPVGKRKRATDDNEEEED